MGDVCRAVKAIARRGRLATADALLSAVSRRSILRARMHRPPVSSRRRPLGLRLWLADLAAGLRLSRTRAGAAGRRAPRALRLLPRPSRHAGAARAWCSASITAAPAAASPIGSRRQRSATRRSPICARASRSPWSTARRVRSVWLDGSPAAARAGALLHGRPRPSAICRPAPLDEQLHLVRQGHGRSGPTATTCSRPCGRWRRSAAATRAASARRAAAASGHCRRQRRRPSLRSER